MKNLKYLFLLLFLGIQSCDDFLDKEPLDMISDAIVWNDKALIDAYLADLYYRTDFMELRDNYGEQTSFAMIASMGGEGRSYGAHHQSYIASTSVITSAGVPSELDFWKYDIIRDCNFFLEKIQDSPLDQSIITQRMAEVRFLRAYIYFQMVIRYGGVPIITKAQPMDASNDDIYVPRDSEKAVYDFILSETQAIAQILPSVYGDHDKGRPSRWAAYALKSRAALYAASIAKFGTQQLDGLLGFPESDAQVYAQISYDASKAIIDNGIHFLYERHADRVHNFHELFLDESNLNKETIMTEVYDYGKNRAHGFTLRASPHDFSGTFATMHIIYDWVERFEFEDGSPGNSITRSQLTTGEWAPSELFGNRDPRFRASVFYPESPWKTGKVLFHSRTIRGGTTYTSGTAEDGWPYQSHARNNLRSGFMVKKRCNPLLSPTPVLEDQTDYIIFRLGETYLNLAEAAFYLGYTPEALTVLNRLRQRAGMPPKETIDLPTIQNERLVELTWENHSYWDLRRWRIAQQWLDGKRLAGLQYTFNYDTKKYKVILINAEGVARTFHERNYYLPIGVTRVTENPNIVENPGY